jgi:hypothetical protein
MAVSLNAVMMCVLRGSSLDKTLHAHNTSLGQAPCTRDRIVTHLVVISTVMSSLSVRILALLESAGSSLSVYSIFCTTSAFFEALHIFEIPLLLDMEVFEYRRSRLVDRSARRCKAGNARLSTSKHALACTWFVGTTSA